MPHRFEVGSVARLVQGQGKPFYVHDAQCTRPGCTVATTYPVDLVDIKGWQQSYQAPGPCLADQQSCRQERNKKEDVMVEPTSTATQPQPAASGRVKNLANRRERNRYYLEHEAEILKDAATMKPRELARKHGIPYGSIGGVLGRARIHQADQQAARAVDAGKGQAGAAARTPAGDPRLDGWTEQGMAEDRKAAQQMAQGQSTLIIGLGMMCLLVGFSLLGKDFKEVVRVSSQMAVK